MTKRLTRPARLALRSQAGMTLLEIMTVLAIIALVMAVLVGPRVLEALRGSKVKTAYTMGRKFAYEAYPQWATNNPSKTCPGDLKELTKYMNSEDVNDPWGHPFHMLCGETAPEGVVGGFGVVSDGENGKADGNAGDDVLSWQEPKGD